mgnify:CR=1 FL=1
MMTVPAGNWLSRNDLSKFKGAIKKMNSKQSKKLRKQYKKALNAKAQSTLKKTIFSLARKRDLIGIIAIIEAVIIAILLFIK